MDRGLAKKLLKKVFGDTNVTKVKLSPAGPKLISYCGRCGYELQVGDSFIKCSDCELNGVVFEMRFGGIDYFPGV